MGIKEICKQMAKTDVAIITFNLPQNKITRIKQELRVSFADRMAMLGNKKAFNVEKKICSD